MSSFLQPAGSTARQATRKSVRQYALFMAYLVAVKLVLTFFPHVFRSPAQAAVFEWKFIGLWTAAGLIGVVLSARTGFPGIWSAAISRRRRIVVPVLLGVGLGIIGIATDAATGWTRIVAGQMKLPSIHIAWPASLLIYPGGAIIVEVVYRLLPIPLLLWVLSKGLLRGKGQTGIFWVLAAATSLLEPCGDLNLWKYGPLMTVALFAEDYALNVLQAYQFRKNGLGASILLRVAFYMVWHVLWGAVHP